MIFVALLEGALILEDEAKSEYFVCIFDASAIDGGSSLAIAKLVVPDITSPTSFIPFYYHDVDRYISVAVSNANAGNIYDYTIPDSITPGSTITGEEWCKIFIYIQMIVLLPLTQSQKLLEPTTVYM